jgi:hypothetical protein
VARLDDRLRRDLERAARPADPAGVYEELIRRRERRRIAHRIEATALAVAVVAATIAGTYALSRVFWADTTTAGGGVSPSATAVPTPSPTSPATSDIGLGFPVCNVTSVQGHFGDAQGVWTAYVATKRGDVGPCPNASEADNVIAIDVTGDGQADAAYGPFGCQGGCSAFAAPDVDGDGSDELLVQDVAFSIAGLRLFEVSGGDGPGAGGAILSPVTVAPPGDPAGGFEPGKELRLWLGGDGFHLDALRCEAGPDGQVLVATSAESKPHDSPNAVWYAHETTFRLRHDGKLDVLGTRDFQEPATSDLPSFATRRPPCGAALPYPFGGG